MLVRNFAAGGLVRDFALQFEGPATGTIEVRRGPFPFFLLASTRAEPLVSGARVRRGVFDASFEIAVIAERDMDVAIA